MARAKSKFLSGFGTALEIFKAIVNEVLAQGGDDDSLRRILTDSSVRKQIAQLLIRRAGLQVVTHMIDGDASPFLPSADWRVEEHRKQGRLKLARVGAHLYLNGQKINLFSAEGQKSEEGVGGDKLRQELASQPVLNANVLDYLLEHPELIPEKWEQDENGHSRSIFFWGTIYYCSGAGLYVRGLCQHNGGWFWCRHSLGDICYGVNLAAVLQVGA